MTEPKPGCIHPKDPQGCFNCLLVVAAALTLLALIWKGDR